jgi:hypothetical protein
MNTSRIWAFPGLHCLEEEISELRNFVTVFKNRSENYETKMATSWWAWA